MPIVAFEKLPPDARLWIFEADRELCGGESSELLDGLDEFLEAWTAHGKDLRVGRDWRYDRFLLIAADEASSAASGCSVDGLFRFLTSIGERVGASLIGNQNVCYRDGDKIIGVTRQQFADLASQGIVGLDTVVFNNTVTKLGLVQQGEWEVPASRSWHQNVFFSKESRAT